MNIYLIETEKNILFSHSRLNRVRFFSYISLVGILNLLLNLIFGAVLLHAANLLDKQIFLITDTLLMLTIKAWLTVRRLNDFNDDWIFAMLPICFTIIMVAALLMGNIVIGLLFGASATISIFIIGLTPGNEYENKYGILPIKYNEWNIVMIVTYIILQKLYWSSILT